MTEWVEGPTLAALSCGKPVYLVVLLPGLGVDGQAMLDLALGWAPAMIKADFVAVPPPASPSQQDDDLAAELDLFLTGMLAKRRLPDSHLALVGFSEGATLALKVGLRREKPIAALVAFSASAFDDGLASSENREQPRILLVHGEADRLSPYEKMLAFKASLKEQGAAVWSFKRPGLGHEIDDDGVAAAGDFLAKHLVHKAPAPHDHAHS